MFLGSLLIVATLCHTYIYTCTLYHTQILSRSLFLVRAHFFSVSLFCSLSLCHYLCVYRRLYLRLYPCLSHTYTHTHSLSVYLGLSLSRIHTHTHTHTHHTHTSLHKHTHTRTSPAQTTSLLWHLLFWWFSPPFFNFQETQLANFSLSTAYIYPLSEGDPTLHKLKNQVYTCVLFFW